MQTIKIPIADIDVHDDTYRYTPHTKDDIPEELRRSFQTYGILHPPILTGRKGEFFQIIRGWKRIQFMSENGSSRCLCHVLQDPGDSLDAWRIALQERTLRGPLTSLEKALFFSKLLQQLSLDEAASHFLPLMGESPQPYAIKKILPLATLEQPLQVALAAGILDEKAALKLCALSFRDRLVLYECIEALQLSLGNQRKLIPICEELAHRNDSSIMELLSQPEVTAIINSQANLPQKAANVMKLLGQLQQPRYSDAKRSFNQFYQQLNLPHEITLTPSQSFETDTVVAHIPFPNKETFLDFWKKNEQTLCSTKEMS